MKKTVISLLVLCFIVVAEATTYRVTPDAAGGGDGQSWASPMTINEAIAAAKADEDTDDIILCKAGTYTPTATIAISTPITFKGGLKGTDDETLAENGKRSVFDAQNNTAITKVFSITTTSGLNTFEGVEIRNAYFRGVFKTGAGSLSFKNCVFDSCGRNYTASQSGKIRGMAGSFTGDASAELTFDGCVFSRNSYESNENIHFGYGAAVGFSTWERVTIDNSLFVSNGLGRACLYSTKGGVGLNDIRGAAIYSTVPLTVRNTEFRANRTGISAALGGIVYIKDVSGTSAFTNCLFLANSCEHCNGTLTTTAAAGVLVFRSSTKGVLDVVNCTFAYNYTDSRNQVSAGIDVGTYISPGSQNGVANIKNTIFYGAQKNANLKGGKDINIASGCSANIDYCLFEENTTACISGSGTINKGNNVFGDPKFTRAITADKIDSVMVSNKYNNVWYYGYSADAYETVFSKADVHAMSRKLTVDTGDPTSPYDKEPRPNGKRVNLGYYGNTPWALESRYSGMLYFVR